MGETANSPVDRSDDGVQREARWMQAVLVPDGASGMLMVTALGRLEGVVDRDNHRKHVAHDGQEPVVEDGGISMSFPPDEGVDY
jgi:hypothetical protein